MGLSKQDLDRALSLQTAKLANNLEAIQERLSAQIMSIKVELDNTKQKIDELTKDIVGNKSALLDMDEKVDTLRNEIENEVLAKIRIANQIWIGNVENLDDAKEMIRRSSDDQIKPMTLRAIKGKQGLKKGKTLGCIAEFNNFEEKMAILKGSSKVLKSDNPKKIYFKANQTPTERQQDKALKAEIANLREALTDTDKEFPVIRNGKIVFLERRSQANGNPQRQKNIQLEGNHANSKVTGARPKQMTKTRKNSKRNDTEENLQADQIVITTEEILT